MGLFLSFVGLLLLLVSLVGVGFGLYMAADPRTREPGKFFALWWVPAVAASSGVMMRDAVTFVVGFLCFLVAGVVFTLNSARPQSSRREGGVRAEGNEATEKTTRENTARNRRAVS